VGARGYVLTGLVIGLAAMVAAEESPPNHRRLDLIVTNEKSQHPTFHWPSLPAPPSVLDPMEGKFLSYESVDFRSAKVRPVYRLKDILSLDPSILKDIPSNHLWVPLFDVDPIMWVLCNYRIQYHDRIQIEKWFSNLRNSVPFPYELVEWDGKRLSPIGSFGHSPSILALVGSTNNGHSLTVKIHYCRVDSTLADLNAKEREISELRRVRVENKVLEMKREETIRELEKEIRNIKLQQLRKTFVELRMGSEQYVIELQQNLRNAVGLSPLTLIHKGKPMLNHQQLRDFNSTMLTVYAFGSLQLNTFRWR